MSNFGKRMRVGGASIYVPTTIGEVWQGGYYAGRLKVDGVSYAVVLSPYASGGSNLTGAYSTGVAPDATAVSRWDGNANMAACVAAGIGSFPAQNFCRNLTIGGYTDWHLPAVDQLDLIYRNFKPATNNNVTTADTANPSMDPPQGAYTSTSPGQTSVTAFQGTNAEAFATNYYLTSTVLSAGTIGILNFSIGQRANSAVTAGRGIRAVRMLRV